MAPIQSLGEPEDDFQVIWETLEFKLQGVQISLSTVRRGGHLDPILFLHGFGGTKEDYTDIQFNKKFTGRPFISYDTPGSGESTCSNLSKVSVSFLVELAEKVIEHFIGRRKFHLLGHSMGGLTALLLAQRHQASVLSFINIKGNLLPEDCFLSRQIFDYKTEDTESFVAQFLARTRTSKYYGDSLYAAAFRAKVNSAVLRPTFESMVEETDRGELLSTFEAFPFPRMYMHGEQFASLSYLGRISKVGVRVVEIPEAGHFVMYSNPVRMWKEIDDFINSQ